LHGVLTHTKEWDEEKNWGTPPAREDDFFKSALNWLKYKIARKLIRKIKKIPLVSIRGLSGGSSVHRPWSEGPHQRLRKLFLCNINSSITAQRPQNSFTDTL
jgi:hypothetical protein